MHNKHVAAIVIVAFLAIVGVVYLSRGTGTSGNPYLTTTIGPSPNTGSCSVYTTQSLQVSAQWLNNSKTPPAYNALGGQTVNVYLPGGANPVQTGTTTTGSVAISGVSSCTNYTVFVGTAGSATFFPNFTSLYLQNQVNYPVALNLLPYSTPTLQASNAISSVFASTATAHGNAAGAVIGNLAFTVKAGTNYDSQGPGIIVLTYNAQAMNPPVIQGAVQVTGSVLNGYSPTFVVSNSLNTNLNGLGAQNAYVAYYLPAGVNGQYSGVSGLYTSQGLGAINPQISLKGAYATNELISLTWLPVGSFYNNAQSSLGGIGPKSGVAVNPFTTANVYATTYTNNAFIIQPTGS